MFGRCAVVIYSSYNTGGCFLLRAIPGEITIRVLCFERCDFDGGHANCTLRCPASLRETYYDSYDEPR